MAVVADFVNIASSDALLGGCQPRLRRSCNASEVGFELHHPRAVEEEALVQPAGDVIRNERSRVVDEVAFALEEPEVFLA